MANIIDSVENKALYQLVGIDGQGNKHYKQFNPKTISAMVDTDITVNGVKTNNLDEALKLINSLAASGGVQSITIGNGSAEKGNVVITLEKLGTKPFTQNEKDNVAKISTIETNINNVIKGTTKVPNAVNSDKLGGIAANEYAKRSDISTVYRSKGSCKYTELPTNANVGDVWNVTDKVNIKGETYAAGTNWVYTENNNWDPLGGSEDFSLYQQKNDDALVTANKTVVGAINEIDTVQNELKHQITNLQNKEFHLKRGNNFGEVEISEGEQPTSKYLTFFDIIDTSPASATDLFDEISLDAIKSSFANKNIKDFSKVILRVYSTRLAKKYDFRLLFEYAPDAGIGGGPHRVFDTTQYYAYSCLIEKTLHIIELSDMNGTNNFDVSYKRIELQEKLGLNTNKTTDTTLTSNNLAVELKQLHSIGDNEAQGATAVYFDKYGRVVKSGKTIVYEGVKATKNNDGTYTLSGNELDNLVIGGIAFAEVN